MGRSLRSFGRSLRGELVHLLFDFFEIFGSERLLAQKFVEKSVFDRRADAELHVGIEFHDRGGQKMRRGMAEDVESVRIFFGEDLKLDVLFQRTAKIEQQAAIFRRIDGIGENSGLFLRAVFTGGVDLGDQSSVRKPRRNRLGDVERCRALKAPLLRFRREVLRESDPFGVVLTG